MLLVDLKKGLPKEIVKYFDYVNQLEFTEKPDYKYLRELLRIVLKGNNFKRDYKYDWVIQKGEEEEKEKKKQMKPLKVKANMEKVKMIRKHARKMSSSLSKKKKSGKEKAKSKRESLPVKTSRSKSLLLVTKRKINPKRFVYFY